MTHDLDRPDRLRGGLLGLVVGDALGVPYEFHQASDIPPRGQIDMTPPAGYARTYPQVPPGTWSDDGAQALVLLDSLVRCGGLDVDDLAAGLLRWRDEGWMAVDDRFDIGIQSDEALRRVKGGAEPATAGATDERANGNGSLMRVLPLALVHEGTDAELVADAAAQSSVTHGHVRSRMCCALYCLWARRLLAGDPVAAAWTDAVATLYRCHGTITDEDGWTDFETHVLDVVGEPPRGTGYVVSSLLAARHLLLDEESYEGVVTGAVALGDDTDTTAAIAGGVAGIVYGEKGIPGRWLDALRGRETLDAALATLG